MLVLDVSNDGPSLDESAERRIGIGLSNVRERLEGRYGEASEVTLSDRDGGVAVRIAFPPHSRTFARAST